MVSLFLRSNSGLFSKKALDYTPGLNYSCFLIACSLGVSLSAKLLSIDGARTSHCKYSGASLLCFPFLASFMSESGREALLWTCSFDFAKRGFPALMISLNIPLGVRLSIGLMKICGSSLVASSTPILIFLCFSFSVLYLWEPFSLTLISSSRVYEEVFGLCLSFSCLNFLCTLFSVSFGRGFMNSSVLRLSRLLYFREF